MDDRRVLVVGTTPDYISYIHERYPGRALFLTDFAQRLDATERPPDKKSEIVCSLSDKDGTLRVLHEHLESAGQSLSGVACYDCEWLSLAAELAQGFALPFPSVDSVLLSRDKYLTKRKWAEHGVRCPKMELIHTGWQTLKLGDQLGSSVVLKPTTGTGSELTFLCRDNYDLTAAFQAIRVAMARRSTLPLYNLNPTDAKNSESGSPFLAEEYIEGREYSADFIIDSDNLVLIRVAKKLRDDTLPFGTTMAYVVPAELPGWLSRETLSDRLREATHALGFRRAICMADFIITRNEVVFLEMTPRIGGDCLPPLISCSCGLDTIALALDFAEGRDYEIPRLEECKEIVGLRLFSSQSGILKSVSCDELSNDSRVKETSIKRAPGHEIRIPPHDYDSWKLGHILFEPRTNTSLRSQCNDLRQKILINVEQQHEQSLAWFHNEGGRVDQPQGPAA